ncbi:MAG: hypothetical protein PHW10_03775 [Candidatus Peribacteraceae bacterium]|nr:hypothetical protein [Candidatus Peribacteraceae bacterium]
MKRSATARLIGNGLAHLQHGMDRLGEWGFRTMRKAASQPSASPLQPSTTKSRLTRILKKALGFVGDAGDTYYATYEELKRKRPPQEPKETK